jgi:Phosphoribosylpyrophosphate synthetase
MYKNYKKKIEVFFSPNTLQSALMNFEREYIRHEVFKFNDGSVKVTINDNIPDHHYCEIHMFMETMDDLMVVAQIKDIVQRKSKSPKDFVLYISSPVYSRYDRVMLDNQTDAFGARVFANFINSLYFDNVILFDCHSNVMSGMINNSYSVEQKLLAETCVGSLENFLLIAPDKGALVKNPTADIVLSKARDVNTGKIIGVHLDKVPNASIDGKDCLLIDDICEGGRTFTEVAHSINAEHSPNLNLYITHGIFSNNAIEKLLVDYKEIYVYFMKESVYDSLCIAYKERLNVYNLIIN